MRKTLLLVLMPVSLIALGLLASTTTKRAWNAFTRYESPFALRSQDPPPQVNAPLAEQVVIVLVDGLALETSRTMPFLNELRQRGADVEIRVGLPSLSLPGRGVLFSGAWQDIHGQMTNFNAHQLSVGHLFESAKRRGLTTSLAAGKDPHTLFSPFVDGKVLYPPSPPDHDLAVFEKELRWMGEVTRAHLEEQRPRFFNLDLTIMDESGHTWGAASEEYRRAALYTDEELRKIAAKLDLTRAVLVVTADHGQAAAGGHGGHEEDVLRTPLVMVGRGIKPGSKASGRQIDTAPTIAALLGMEIPPMAQGEVLLDVLDTTAEQRLDILRVLAAQKERFAERYARVLAEPAPALLAGTAPAGEAGYRARLEELRSAIGRVTEKRHARDATGRLGYTLIALLLPLVGLGVALRARAVSPRELGLAAGGAALALVLYAALFPVLGLGYSFTAVNKDELLQPFFMKDMALAVSACAVAAALAGALARRREPELGLGDLARLTWWLAGAFCYLFGVKIALVYWREGVILHWRLADLFWGFGFYLDVLAVMAVGFCAPALPLLAWAGGRLGRRADGADRSKREG